MCHPGLVRAMAVAVLALAVPATGVLAQSSSFDPLDRNLDQILERDEFDQDFRSRGIFARLDRDGDERLSAGELTAGVGDDPRFEQRYGSSVLRDWDSDRSGSLDAGEFSTGLYDSYDQDGSAGLDAGEFATYAGDAGEGGVLDLGEPGPAGGDTGSGAIGGGSVLER